MDEQELPIDINTTKLLDWLISRRHVNKDWQTAVLKIREKINSAIQDMPEHDGIVKLLSGQHINYFYCLKIIEILKETEADSKNVFGQYRSKRMKDWQDIVQLYQKDNLYLGEAAQLLIRNVSYEIPASKKQITKLEQMQAEYEKKRKDYSKAEVISLQEFNATCKQLGIEGKNIKKELFSLLKELPGIYDKVATKTKSVQTAVDLYVAFVRFHLGNEDVNVLSVLRHVILKGNTTAYEYIYGKKPVSIVLPEEISEETSEKSDSNGIDFGDINSENSVESNFSVIQGEIDWGNGDCGFEIVDHEDVTSNLDETGVTAENVNVDSGIAKGLDAYTVLDSPKTRDQLLDDLMELDSFLKMRMIEITDESDILTMSLMQNAPTILQIQTVDSIASMKDAATDILNDLTNKRIQHLHNIKHSANYIDILTENLNHKLSIVEKMQASKEVLNEQHKNSATEIQAIQVTIKDTIQNLKVLQKEIEEDISKKYKGRPVHLIGGVNAL